MARSPQLSRYINSWLVSGIRVFLCLRLEFVPSFLADAALIGVDADALAGV